MILLIFRKTIHANFSTKFRIQFLLYVQNIYTDFFDKVQKTQSYLHKFFYKESAVKFIKFRLKIGEKFF
jgi:nitrate reductase assembly molybdenum cofactor insertion protein NarJ